LRQNVTLIIVIVKSLNDPNCMRPRAFVSVSFTEATHRRVQIVRSPTPTHTSESFFVFNRFSCSKRVKAGRLSHHVPFTKYTTPPMDYKILLQLNPGDDELPLLSLSVRFCSRSTPGAAVSQPCYPSQLLGLVMVSFIESTCCLRLCYNHFHFLRCERIHVDGMR